MGFVNEIGRCAGGLALAAIAGITMSATPAQAQSAAKLEKIKVHSDAIAGNLEGNSADRTVYVYLPPSYGSTPGKHYPVVYFLHGFFFDVAQYDPIGKFTEAMTARMADGPEFILVLPDSHTRHAGSMYANSVTVGNFEGFIAKELVAYIDGHYRTIAKPAARGIGGHSMGGYGTMKIAMKYSGVFSSVYAMSACCLMPGGMTPETGKAIEALSLEEAQKADFGTRAMLASAAAWAPNPDNPPFFFDWLTKDGVVQTDIMAQWYANAPNALVAQYVPALKSYSSIGLEIGTQDGLIGVNAQLDKELTKFGIKHSYATFEGGHADKFAERVKDFMIPFFQAQLATE